MNTERLLDLIDVIENEVSDLDFDLSHWMRGPKADCGTTGCAAGWYIFHRPESGLVLEQRGAFHPPYWFPARRDQKALANSVRTLAEFSSHILSEHFGLDHESLFRLFGPRRLTRREWLERAKRFLAENGITIPPRPPIPVEVVPELSSIPS
jgi:hypothetical protein